MLKAGKLGRLALGQFSGEGIQVCNAMLVSCLLAVKQKLLIIGKKKKKKCATPNHTLFNGKSTYTTSELGCNLLYVINSFILV